LNEGLRRRMNNPKGLKKGLVQQWNAATSPMEKLRPQMRWGHRFAFLKAFLLDKEMGSIQVDAYYEEMSESKDKEKFIELPLCEIMERWGKLPGGEQFVKDIQASQTGKKHPQTSDANWRIYRVFKEMEISSILVAYIII
ncbi:NaCP60E, partial [Symbiodinium necroappetens]